MIQLIFVLVSAICRDILRIKYTVLTRGLRYLDADNKNTTAMLLLP